MGSTSFMVPTSPLFLLKISDLVPEGGTAGIEVDCSMTPVSILKRENLQ